MAKEITKKSKNEADLATIGFLGVFTLLAFPFVVGVLIARGIVSMIVNRRHNKIENKMSIILSAISLILYVGISITLAFVIGNPSEAKALSWYDYLFPIATEIKVIIGGFQGVGSILTDVLLTLVTPIGFGIIISPIIYMLRPMAKKNYITSIKYYEKKLSAEEVAKDPRKEISAFQHFYFFILVLDRKRIESRKLSKNDLKEKQSTHIMLDHRYGIPRKYLNRHLAIMGTTGSGKTETTFNFLKDSISHSKPTILVDGKGDIKNIFRMKALADKYNKPFNVFTLGGRKLTLPHLENEEGKIEDYDDFIKSHHTDKRNKLMEKLDNGEKIDGFHKVETIITPSAYNPFATDNEGILVDTIMSLFDYSEEHYKAGARVYMDLLVSTLLDLNIPVSWDNIMLYLDKWKLIEALKKRYHIEDVVPKKEMKQEGAKATKGGKIILTKASDKIASQAKALKASSKDIKRAKDVKGYNIDLNQIQNIDTKAITGFTSRIGMYYNTTRETITEDGFTLGDCLSKNGVVVFSLNSLDYQEQASAIGRLIVNNIKASAELNSKLKKQTCIALDEFNVFADNNVIDILNKTRSKGYEMILAFQSIADLTKISEDFKNQVIENTNNKIIHNTNDPVGAEYIAKVLGTYKEQKKTYQAEEDELQGGESVRIVDSFIAHPNDIKTLKTGEAFAKYTKEDGSLFTTPHKIKIILNNK